MEKTEQGILLLLLSGLAGYLKHLYGTLIEQSVTLIKSVGTFCRVFFYIICQNVMFGWPQSYIQ